MTESNSHKSKKGCLSVAGVAPVKTTRTFFSPVSFIVGPEDEKNIFWCHKDIAASASPFFKAAFESNMIEGITQEMRLKDVDPVAFGLIIHWAYTDSIYLSPTGREHGDPHLLARLWVLAERFLISNLQNRTLLQIQKALTHSRGGSTEMLDGFMKVAFEDRIGDTPLKSLAIYHLAFGVDEKTLQQALEKDSIPLELLVSVFKLLREKRRNIRNVIDLSVHMVGE